MHGKAFGPASVADPLMLARANAMHRAGRLDEAERTYRQLLLNAPRDPRLCASLGELLLRMGRHAEAIGFLEVPAGAKKASADDLNNLGYAHLLNGTYEFGLEPLRKARERAPRSWRILLNLGQIYLKMGNHKAAVPMLERALTLEGAPTTVRLMLASAVADLGDFDRARALNEQCALDPALRPRALRSLASLGRQTRENHLLDRILPEIETAAAPEAAVPLHYAAAKTYLDLKESDAAFHHLKGAKALYRIRFDRQRFLDSIGRSRACGMLATELVARSDPKPAPVFIVGMPRCGSSLTEQILSCHPGLFGAGEREYIPTIARRLGYETLDAAAYRDAIRNLPPGALDAIAEGYRSLIATAGFEKGRSLDKFLHNFLHVGLIKLLFPAAQIIHCRRQALDCCFSIYTSPFDQGHSYANDLADLGWYYRRYEGLMREWQALFPGSVLDVHYEDTVQDLEASARRILDFLELPWNPAVLDFTQSERGVATVSKWQVRQPLYSTSVNRWKAHEKNLAPLIDALKG